LKGECFSDRLADEVLAFIASHSDRPFFAYLAEHAVHAPFSPKPEPLKKYETRAAGLNDRRNDAACAAMIEAVDQNVGRIIDALAKLKLTDDTMIVFTSDNGGPDRGTAPLKGGKGQLYEGGIRVPLVVSWSGLKRSGSRCDAPVSTIDWYPTFLELAGQEAPKSHRLDDVSLVPVFHGASRLSRNQLL